MSAGCAGLAHDALPAPGEGAGELDRARPSCVVKRLGVVDYAPALEAMRAFTAAREAATTDEIWLLQHPPVFTLGQAGKAEHLLQNPAGIPLVHIDRGGQITYHGPGQLVAYLLIDLPRRALKVRELVLLMEQAIIDTLADYGIAAERKDGAPGVYVAGDVHSGSTVLALGCNPVIGQRIDDRLLHQQHQFAHFERAPRQVDQQIGDELAGAVVGDLAAAVDVHQRDAGRVLQQVFGLARLAEGKYRRMLEQPDLVGGGRLAGRGKRPHRLERRRVVHHAEALDHAGRAGAVEFAGPLARRRERIVRKAGAAGAHSTTLTIGCAVSSRYIESTWNCDTARNVQVTAR